MSKWTSGLIAGALLLAWGIPATAERPGAAGPKFSAPALAANLEALAARVDELEEDNAALRRLAEGLAGDVALLLATDVSRSRSLACIDEFQSNERSLVLRGCDLRLQKGSDEAGGSLFVHDVSAPDNESLVVRAPESLILTSGAASVLLNRNGDISIRGKDIDIDASSGVDIKATADVVIKGSKILDN